MLRHRPLALRVWPALLAPGRAAADASPGRDAAAPDAAPQAVQAPPPIRRMRP